MLVGFEPDCVGLNASVMCLLGEVWLVARIGVFALCMFLQVRVFVVLCLVGLWVD